MKILVTGATGLVGGELTNLCLENNIAVNYLTTNREKLLNKTDFNGFYWNPEKGEIDPDCFKGVTAVINLAGASVSKRWSKAHKARILSSRINSIRTLCKGFQEIENGQIDTFITASAIGIYPSSLENFYIEDTDIKDEGFLGSVVQAWEEEAELLEQLKIRVAKVRIGLVLSDRAGALAEMVKPIKNYLGAIFGSGEQWQSWIHLHDLARIFLFILENRLEGNYNAVAPNPVTNAKLTREIARILDRPLLLPNVPQFALKLALGEMSSLLFSSQRVSSKKIEEEGFDFSFPNVSRALEDILLGEADKNAHDDQLQREFV